MILTIDQVNDALDEMAEGFPQVLFEELNGGVNLLEEALPDPQFPEGEMYILGEYCEDVLGGISICTTAPSPPWRSGRTGTGTPGPMSSTPPSPTS